MRRDPRSWSIKLATWSVATLLPVLAACPADDTTGGFGETGGEGPGDAVPIDPFDGEGSNPPGSPSLARTWRSPASLGNGLVHDSRYDLQAGEYTDTFSAAELVAGIDWTEFVASHRLKVARGFRPTNVDADVTLIQSGEGTSASFKLGITDRSTYVSDDDANYKTVVKTHMFSQVAVEQQSLAAAGPSSPGRPRPISVDTFATAVDRLGTTIAWVYDNSEVPWRLIISEDAQTFATTIEDLRSADYRPISIASRRRNGVSEYSAVFVSDGMPATDWKATIGYDWADLAANVQSLWDDGMYPFRGSYEQGSHGDPTFNVLWTKRSPQLKLELRYNMDQLLFNAEDINWRKKGYHLENACAYSDAGVTRYAGLWVRNDPYLRYEPGPPVDPQSDEYKDRYQPFHDRAIQVMTLAGESREGEFFRPSATLHIFEGSDLVLSRAYTYAPAIYPETVLDAPMNLASASKSITAAAVVREMALRNIPLTAPFAPAAGINFPELATVPTIADVLRNLGGFNTDVQSYSSHETIGNLNGGQYPVTGKMMYDYFVSQKPLNTGNGNSYWDLFTYSNREFVYSNAGFTMLGELVRVQSGLAYRDYAKVNLFAPLLPAGAVYPDPGHRKDARGPAPGFVPEPTQAGLRSYLINSMHPYNPVECEAVADCGYLTCSQQPCPPSPTCTPAGVCTGCSATTPCRQGWDCVAGECVNTQTPYLESERVPEPRRGDSSPTWSVNTGPADDATPTYAAEERYAGRRFAGGAPLAAGGWHGDGRSAGLLIREICQSQTLMPQTVSRQLWDPIWWNPDQDAGPNWNYGLGWYVRGNWVAWIGGTDGAMSVVAHNRSYDFTVVLLANVIGNGASEFLNPLLVSNNGAWSPPGPQPGSPSPSPASVLGKPFPCIDDPVTPANECQGAFGAY